MAAPATSDAAGASTLSMKLLVDTKAGRVLYAEAGKDVVDFIFSLLTLPIATVVKLLGKDPDSMVGCVGNVYASVESLDDTYVEPGAAKDALLRPTVLSPAAAGAKSSSLFCLPAPPPPKFFRCNNNNKSSRSYIDYDDDTCVTHRCRDYMTDTRGWKCPCCDYQMNTELKFLSSSGSGDSVEEEAKATTGNSNGGLVRGIVTYTVMDDLKVAPMSTISGITLLNTFGVTDIGTLKEKTVQLGYAEGLEILRLSLQSKTVLTDVFLGLLPGVFKAAGDSVMDRPKASGLASPGNAAVLEFAGKLERPFTKDQMDAILELTNQGKPKRGTNMRACKIAPIQTQVKAKASAGPPTA